MKKLLFIVLISGFCVAGNDVRPRMITMVLLNDMNQQQLLPTEIQSLSKVEQQNHSHQKPKLKSNNNHYCIKRRNKQQNAHIHQPRSNNYVAKNRR